MTTTNYFFKFLKTLLLLFFITPFSLDAQKDVSFSQYQRSEDEQRVQLGRELSKWYVSENLDSLRIVGEDLFFYGLDNGYQPAIQHGKITLGEYYIQVGNISQGLDILKSLLSVADEQEDEQLKLELYKKITLGYCRVQDAKSALVWSSKIKQLQKKQSDKLLQIEGNLLYAEALLLSKRKDEAIKVYYDYIKKAKQIPFDRGISSAQAKLGDLYRLENNLVQAEKCFQASLIAAKKTKLTTPIAHAINNLAILYFEQGNTKKAKEYFDLGLKYRLQASNQRGISESYYNLGDYYFYTNDLSNSILWYQKSLNHAKKHHLLKDQKDALIAISNVYKSAEDYKNAYLFQEQAMQVATEMSNENLRNEEELSKLQHEIWMQDQYSEPKKNKTNDWCIATIGLGILLCISCLVIVVLMRRKNQFNFPGKAN